MSAVERFKRAHDVALDMMKEECLWLHKKPKLDSVGEQASTDALINKNHLQQHKLDSAKKQAGANALPGKNQELRRKYHSAEPVLKRDAMQPSEQKPLQSEAAEKSAKKEEPLTGRTQLTRTQSTLKLLQTAHDGLKQELKELKKQQAEVIKKEVEAALDWQVVNAINENQTVLVEDVTKIVRK